MGNAALEEDARKRLMGFNRFCGIQLDEVDHGYSRGSCVIEEHHLNPVGIAHGGMICTLMDVCSGTAAVYAGEEKRGGVTQSCNIHYLRPVTGNKMTCEARVVKAGRRTSLVQAELFRGDGELAAVGSFSFFYTD